MRQYAGVGSRKDVPQEVLARATKIASELRDAGWTLRSGGAVGMDEAWLQGAKVGALPHKTSDGIVWSISDDVVQAVVLRPEHCTQAAYELASRFHPMWNSLSHRTKLLHGRNCMIVLGSDLRTPVERILCWTPGGMSIGGTAMALHLALIYNIPVTNLADEENAQWKMNL